MIRFIVLGSGSSGNALLITTDTTNVLVDAGLSAREIMKRLSDVGVDYESLDAIVITHEHSDHIGGLRMLLQKVDCPVYISRETEDAYYWTRKTNGNGESEGTKRRECLKERAVEIESSREFRIGDIDFDPFSVPHDAVDNFGFIAKHDGVRIATLTDFGHITPLMKEKLRSCDAIVIESNHSRDMLRACKLYTWDLKQRISSRHGHLSNEDLCDWLTKDFDGSARHIVLAHLSQRANEPHLALLMAKTALEMRMPLFRPETEINLSFHNRPTDWITF
jgi:phosphoribosyl 1,2-cyclic phosphodiesterase